MAAALGLACLLLRVWRGSLDVPYFLTGIDTAPFVAGVKGVLENGWYFSNPSLGAPGGSDLIDFAGGTAENLQWLAIKVLGLITGSPAATTNVYLLLGFPAVAGVAWAVLRRLRASRLSSFVGAILFAFLPYHFAQLAMGHHFLATYVAVPLGGWLVIRAILGLPLLMRRPSASGLRAWVSTRNAGMLAAVVVVGASTLYYAVFTLLLLIGAGLVAGVLARSWRGALSALSAVAGVGSVLVLSLLPMIIHRVTAGPNPGLAARQPFESEVFSLSLTQLLVPVQGHRIGALARAYEESVASTTVVGERGNQLGTVLAVALLLGFVCVAAWAISARVGSVRARRIIGSAGVAAAMAFLIGTFGGVSSLVAIYLSPQLRTWSRVAPFIAFFAVVVLVLALDWLATRVRARTGTPAVGTALVLLVGVLGMLDQVPDRVAPDYVAEAAIWGTGAAFVRQVEQAVPRGSSIATLPYVPFPESGAVAGVGPYDHLTGYLHSRDLRWSFGAIRGREEDWQAPLQRRPPRAMVDAAMARGFAGIYLDTAGYADGGSAVRAAVNAAVGRTVTPITSADGRRQFLPLRG